MRKDARVFFVWTPLHLLIAKAAAARCDHESAAILIWVGSKNSEWFKATSRQRPWARAYDLSDWAGLTFWDYLRNYGRIFQAVLGVLEDVLANHSITEISIATDDEYCSLVFLKAYGKLCGGNPWSIVSLLEDGTGLYCWRRHRRMTRHVAKLTIDSILLRRSLPWNLGYLSGNPKIAKIYAICPDLVPCKAGKEIVDVKDGFQIACQCSHLGSDRVTALPPGSAIILSERSRLVSCEEEIGLIREMVNYLTKDCGIQNIYVKYHHFDPPSKRAIYSGLGVIAEIGSPNVPYEILHGQLRPAYIVSISSAALYYCSLLNEAGTFVAFFGKMRSLRRLARLYRQRNIVIMPSGREGP